MQGRNAQTKDTSEVADLAAQTLIRRYSEECEGLLPYVKDLIRDHTLSASGTQTAVSAKLSSSASKSITKA